MSDPLYFNGKLCSGSGRSSNEYTVIELKEIARENGIKIPSGLKKREICELLKETEVSSVPQFDPRKPISRSKELKETEVSSVPQFDPRKPISRSIELKEKEVSSVPQFDPKKPIFRSIEHLMEHLEVDDARKLINFSQKELEEIIAKMNLYDGTMTMTEYLKDYEGSERVKKFLIALASKFCRCLKKLESKPANNGVVVQEKPKRYNPNAVCSKSVFTSKGLKGPGSSFQCSPTELLLAPKGKKYVLEKK